VISPSNLLFSEQGRENVSNLPRFRWFAPIHSINFTRFDAPHWSRDDPEDGVQNGDTQARNEVYKFEHHCWAAADSDWILRFYTGSSLGQSVGPIEGY
jgi:hypothetical protein